MTKEEIIQEANRLKCRLDEIEDKAKMELTTANFLQQQANRLIFEYNHPSTTFERKEQIVKEMESLQGRMFAEAKNIPKDNEEMLAIHNRIIELHDLWTKQNNG